MSPSIKHRFEFKCSTDNYKAAGKHKTSIFVQRIYLNNRPDGPPRAFQDFGGIQHGPVSKFRILIISN